MFKEIAALQPIGAARGYDHQQLITIIHQRPLVGTVTAGALVLIGIGTLAAAALARRYGSHRYADGFCDAVEYCHTCDNADPDATPPAA